MLDDDRRACEYGFRGARFFAEGIGTYFFSPHRIVDGLDDLARPAPARRARRGDGEPRRKEDGPLNVVIGDPAAARESVARFQAAGVDELILVMQMGTVPHEIVLESMRTFAEKVMPDFS